MSILTTFTLNAQVPFTCEGQFLLTLSKNGDSKLVRAEIDPVTNSVNFAIVNNSMRVDINAIGYRNQENLIYGIDPNRHDLYRVDATGNVEVLTSLPLDPTLSYFAGDITPDGRFLILIGGTGTAFFGSDVEMAMVDLTVPGYPVSRTPLSGATTRIYDIAFNPLSGVLYGFDSNNERLVIIDPDNAEVFANYPMTGLVDNAGSLFFDAFGNLFAYGGGPFSEQNKFYRVDTETGEFSILTSGPNAEGTDACSCPYTLEMQKTVLPAWVYPCEEVEYVFAVANGSGLTQTNILFRDLLPRGFTFVELLENPFGGTLASSPGDRRIIIQGIEVPPGIDSIRVLVNVGQANMGIHLNQARLEGLPISLGSTVVSDDPRTLAKLDSTFLEIRRIPFDTLIEDRILCDNDSFIANLSRFGRDFIWDDGLTTPIREIDEPGTYEVMVTAGCDTSRVIYNVEGHSVEVSLDEDEISIKLGDTIILSPQIFNTGDSTFVTWLDEEGHVLQCGECSLYQLLPLKSGTYTVIVSNEYGCEDQDEIRINVDNSRDIFVPNAFSPNFDNINDIFYVQGQGFGRIENFYIYDRWGELIYHVGQTWINQEDTGWDGTFRDEVVLPGVYVWMAEITFLDNETEYFSGDVTVIR
ncbi:MAG: gliding motility-associated C-terminal domain-containing protein [Saprospiraceae bacterium]|nr:gliding motility-associated C-terminal domain-containing protein [Saprospiraceae bacterium]